MLQREHGGQKETDLVEPRLCHRKTEPLDVGLGFVDRSSRSAYAVADGEVVDALLGSFAKARLRGVHFVQPPGASNPWPAGRMQPRMAVNAAQHKMVATPPLRSRVQKTPPTYSPASAMTARTIIIDHGSGYVKSGFSGWNEPQLIHPNIVNYRPCRENPGPSSARRVLGLGIDSIYPDTFSYPIQRGRVLNWEGVEHIWSFVLEKHKKGHEVSPVLVTESPLREPMDRKKTLEIMFESLCVPSLLLADQMEMSLYSSGFLTGVVMDSGFGLTRVQPFHQGQPLRSGQKVLEFAGQDLSAYLKETLFPEQSNISTVFRLHMADRIQLNQCYVPQNLGEAIDLLQSLPVGSDGKNTYYLPDGTSMELTPMQRLGPEMFFSPEVFNLQVPSLPQALMDSIKACEDSLQPLLLSHVIPCGGNSMYPGFGKRLHQELNILHSSGSEVSVQLGCTRQCSVWLGASIVAHLSTYKSEWITKVEYDER